jgi:hypothetical protein
MADIFQIISMKLGTIEVVVVDTGQIKLYGVMVYTTQQKADN